VLFAIASRELFSVDFPPSTEAPNDREPSTQAHPTEAPSKNAREHMRLEPTAAPLLQTSLPGFDLWRRGKVRDVYDLGERLLIVATDRLSAFDVVLPTGIPGKGVVLTQMSLFWFELLRDVVQNHVITAEVSEYGP